MTLAAAGVLFSVQFLFTKQYQLRAGAGWRPAIWMLVFANLWMGFLFLSAGFGCASCRCPCCTRWYTPSARR